MKEVNSIRDHISNKNKRLLRFLTIIFSFLLLIISSLIYMKKDENATLLKKYFNVDMDFSSINLKIDSLVGSLFSFLPRENASLVNSNIIYLKSDEKDYYFTENNQIPALENGIIYYVGEEENGTYSVLIDYGDNLYAAYYQVIDVKVKTYDQIKKGDYFCSYLNEFKVLFKKDGKLIDYFK